MASRFLLEKTNCDEFFNLVLKKSNLKSFKQLSDLGGVKRQTWDRYRSGKTSIPNNLFNILIGYLNSSERKYFLEKSKILDPNWGRIKGGKEAYKRNKLAFVKGRIKGMQEILRNKPLFSFDYKGIDLDESLAHIIGLWIGDGFSNKYLRYYLTQFVGHKTELKYYREIVCNYLKEKLGLNPIIKEYERKNFIRINIYSKAFFDLITKKFNLSPGRKSLTVLIPEVIRNSKRKILLSCIAGIYDAEGCVFFDKRKNYSKPYPRIDIHMLNLGILEQIKEALDEEGIVCSFANIGNKNSRVLVYGERNIKKFLEKVPIKNPKLTDKLKAYNLLR